MFSMIQSDTTIELERTFLARSFPPTMQGVQPIRLKDVYVPDTGTLHPRLRLRKKGDRYEITKKVPIAGADASAHTETTIPLEQDEYEALARSSTKFVEKDRYNVDIDGYSAEVDVFVGVLKGLVLIDFEFETAADMDAFIQPDVCLADVTQEDFIAGGLLAGRTYADIAHDLAWFDYVPLMLD